MGLIVLSVAQLTLGVWTQWFPASFYASVPTVDLTPPYSEHFVRDFGGAITGLGLVLGVAAVCLERRLVLTALTAYLVFAVPHTAFHLHHLDKATTTQAAALVTVLSMTVLMALVLLVTAVRVGPSRTSSEPNHTLWYGFPMVMATRNQWLDQGLEFLSRAGIPALRVDNLARELGVTKGSFYHHFVDLADYRRALLAHFEELCTTRYIDASQRLHELPPVERLLALADAVLADADTHRGLEVQIRSWAVQDDDAEDTLARVDARRLAHLTELALGVVGETGQAADLAAAIYYLLIGSEHASPAGSTDQLRRLWLQVLNAATSQVGQ